MREDKAWDKVMDITDEMEEEFLKESLKRIKARTPVQSGTARDGWFIKSGSIFNRVDYVKFLELGTWKMRPIAMVKRTAAEADQILKQVIRKIGGR